MPKVTKRMPSFEGVGAGQMGTLRLPIGRTYHQLLMTYAGVTLAQMTGIRIVGNGKTLQNLGSGADLDKANRFNGRTAADGVLVIDFERYGIETKDGREITALGTGMPKDPTPLTTLSVEVDIDAAAAAPAIDCKALQSSPKPLGMFQKIRRFNYSATGSGDFEIADLPRGDLINKVYFIGSGINSVKLERDSFVVYERNRTENELVQENGVRVPQAGMFVYDPTEFGIASETLATAAAQDLRFTLNMAAAANIRVVVEYIGAITS